MENNNNNSEGINYEEWFKAIENGDLDTFYSFLQLKGLNINKVDSDGNTGLMLAVQFFKQKGIEIEDEEENEKDYHFQIIKYFLDQLNIDLVNTNSNNDNVGNLALEDERLWKMIFDAWQEEPDQTCIESMFSRKGDDKGLAKVKKFLDSGLYDSPLIEQAVVESIVFGYSESLSLLIDIARADILSDSFKYLLSLAISLKPNIILTELSKHRTSNGENLLRAMFMEQDISNTANIKNVISLINHLINKHGKEKVYDEVIELLFNEYYGIDEPQTQMHAGDLIKLFFGNSDPSFLKRFNQWKKAISESDIRNFDEIIEILKLTESLRISNIPLKKYTSKYLEESTLEDLILTTRDLALDKHKNLVVSTLEQSNPINSRVIELLEYILSIEGLVVKIAEYIGCPYFYQSSPVDYPYNDDSLYINFRPTSINKNTVVDIPKDGNCFYHAAALFLNRPTEEIRQTAINEIRNNPKTYEGFINQPLEDFLIQQRPGEWADHQMIQAVANAFNILIRINLPDGNNLIIIPLRPTELLNFLPIIELQYTDGIHYNAVIETNSTSGEESHDLECAGVSPSFDPHSY